jgi:MOSC domain-containing protein YiiM
MRVASVNVGLPREVLWRGRPVVTAIFKEPVTGPVRLRRDNLDGDAQADLSVHGGPDKAVYAYPSEHYAGWSERLGRELTPASFGENLTTEGLIERSVHIGDEFRIGTARLVVTQPRLPCYKLGLRFGDPGMVKRFLIAGQPGIYFGILEEGEIQSGDPIELVHEDPNRISLTEMFHLILDNDPDPAAVLRLLNVRALAAGWREEFEGRFGQQIGRPPEASSA